MVVRSMAFLMESWCGMAWRQSSPFNLFSISVAMMPRALLCYIEAENPDLQLTAFAGYCFLGSTSGHSFGFHLPRLCKWTSTKSCTSQYQLHLLTSKYVAGWDDIRNIIKRLAPVICTCRQGNEVLVGKMRTDMGTPRCGYSNRHTHT